MSAAISFDDELEAALDEELGDLIEIITPSEMAAYIQLVSNQITSLDYDIAANSACFGEDAMRLWEDFKKRWAAFVVDATWTARLWLGTQRSAERFAVELRKYRTLFTSRCGKEPTLADSPTPSEAQATERSGFLSGLGGTLTTIVIVGVVGYVVIQWAGKRKW